jgi:hypothetical protein
VFAQAQFRALAVRPLGIAGLGNPVTRLLGSGTERNRSESREYCAVGSQRRVTGIRHFANAGAASMVAPNLDGKGL